MKFYKFFLIFLFINPVFSNQEYRYQLQSDTVKIAFGGDTHFVWGIEEYQERKGINSQISYIKELLQQFDFRALNLETAFSKNAKSVDFTNYVFRSSPEQIQVLKDLGLNLAIFANNHSMDLGLQGLQDTIKHFQEYQIPFVGMGNDLNQALEPYIVEIHGVKFAFFAISFIGRKEDFADGKKSGIGKVHPLLFQKIKDAKTKQKVDYVFLSVHWGMEYQPFPSEEQKRWKNQFFQQGVNFIIGHHPHIPQGIEVYNDKAIVYSLGNFLFGSLNYYQDNNIVAVFHFDRASKKFIGIEVFPISGKNRKYDFQPKLPTYEDRKELFQKLYILSKKEQPNQTILISNTWDSMFFKVPAEQ
ncbi:MAG: CapA family protein [Leptospiraceae bacterium]|nr:CapA family protein [Leptospiraceae bacterium]MDW7976316.1 CapA family protein [Leptospiraceae bacterium]